MKCHLTRFEKLAVTSHLVGLPSPNPEHGRKRLQGWDQLGVAELADKLAAAAAVGVGAPLAKDWIDTVKPELVDITPDVLEHLVAGLGQPTQGIWADTCTRVRERFEQLRDKKYKLPDELRDKK